MLSFLLVPTGFLLNLLFDHGDVDMTLRKVGLCPNCVAVKR
jgi:hypothetical protein